MKYKRIIAIVLSVVMVISSSMCTFGVTAQITEDITEELVDNATDIITGVSGEAASCYWEFDPSIETLSFYGYDTSQYKCDEFSDKVKKIVFTDNTQDIQVDRNGSVFPNLETIVFSDNVFLYEYAVFKESTKIKEYIVDEENWRFKSINGDLYQDSPFADGYDLARYAVGKGESIVTVPDGTIEVYRSAFYGNTKTTKLILPESVTTLELPFYDGELIDEIEIQNPDCQIDFSGVTAANKDLVITSYAGSYVEKQCMGYEIDFEEIDTSDIESIEVKTLPENMTVIRGLDYTPNGLELQINYKNGENRIATYGYEVKVDTSIVGKSNVQISYDGLNTNFEIDVVEIPEEKRLKLDEKKNVTLQSKASDLYYLDVEKDGIYRIFTEGESNTVVSVYDNSTLLKKDNDSGSLLNGQVEIELKAKKVYTIKVASEESIDITTDLKATYLGEYENNEIIINDTLLKDYIEPDEKLEIKYTVSGLIDDQVIYYGEEPSKLEKSNKGVWGEISLQDEIDWNQTVYTLKDEAILYIDLNKYYGMLDEGEYRYTHLMGNKEISTTFHIFDISKHDRFEVLSKNETKNVTLAQRAEKKTFYFRATNDNKCTFYTNGDYDTYATLNCLSDGTTVATGDDSKILISTNHILISNNFKISTKLKTGYVYELIVSSYSYGEQTFELVSEITCTHKYQEIIEEATCKELGKIINTCKYCLYSNYVDVPKLEHQLESNVINPTCIEEGYTNITCKNCDYLSKENYVEPLGHKYDVLTVPPKDGYEGYTVHICKVCDDMYKTEYVEKTTEEPTEQSTEKVTKDTETKTVESTTTVKKLTTTKINKLTAGKKKIKVSWKKIKGAQGYQIKICKKKNFKKSITKNVIKTKITIKKLKSNQRYYVKVRGYKYVSGKKKYSNWSKIRKIKTK